MVLCPLAGGGGALAGGGFFQRTQSRQSNSIQSGHQRFAQIRARGATVSSGRGVRSGISAPQPSQRLKKFLILI